MKRFFEIVMPIKSAVCYIFSASMCILMAVGWLLRWDSLPLSYVFSLLLISLAGGVLQILAYTDILIKRMPYTRRMLLFTLPFLAILSAVAWIFRWFPTEQVGSWLIFLGIFLLIFVATSLGFEIYFRAMGRKYDGLLGQYRRGKENRE